MIYGYYTEYFFLKHLQEIYHFMLDKQEYQSSCFHFLQKTFIIMVRKFCKERANQNWPICLNPLQENIILFGDGRFFKIVMYNKMTIELYLDYISQPSRALLAYCKILSIPIVIKQVRIAKLQHLSEEYTAINPMRKVPAIRDTDNGLIIGESHAIMLYLSRKFSNYLLTNPQNNEILFAKVEEYLHYHHTNTRKCALLIYSGLFSKLYPVQQSTIANFELLLAEIKTILEFINTNYFKDSSYLIGTRLTAADLSAFFQIKTLELLDFDFTKLEKISKWLTIMSKIPEVVQADANYTKTIPKLKALRASL